MNGYQYTGGYNGDTGDENGQGNSNDLMMMRQNGDMTGGQSLDDIVNQNSNNVRRQSLPQQYGASPNRLDTDVRRISMMDYNNGGSPISGMGNVQFSSNMGMDQNAMMGASSPANPAQQQMRRNMSRQDSGGGMSINTNNYAISPQNFSPMMGPNSAYDQSPAQGQMDMSMTSPYPDQSMGMSMEYNLDPSMTSSMTPDAMNMNLYDQSQFGNPSMASPMTQGTGQINTPMSTRPDQDSGRTSSMNTPYAGGSNNGGSSVRGLSQGQSGQMPNATATSSSQNPMNQYIGAGQKRQNSLTQQQKLQQPNVQQKQQQQTQPGNETSRSQSTDNTATQEEQKFDGTNGPIPIGDTNAGTNEQLQKTMPWKTPKSGFPSSMSGKPHMQSAYKNAYSSTGFDMLGVLMRVSTRPNPEINIGSVDLSCAFVVCDAEKDDIPIVYCSENFERLTGYTKHMILGRNCRFLQSPDGNVAPGVRRKYVDDDSVLYLKNMINMRKESQISLINYRRGGQPFMNLLTMIPISWDSSDQVKFFVGFQVDLVEQPNSVTNKNADGSYSINYQRGLTMPRYIHNAPDPSQKTDLGQTIPRDDVSAILSTIGSGESEYAKRMWDKVLLENTDDVVHVLSLKGLFQWVSPSALRVLEYEPSEIIGTALSSICHPSDIVPVTRELKDTSSGASVNVVFRIRRKNSGYMWFEGHGSLHTEQAKGRKSIIMVGRERPVYTLSKSAITNAGGVGDGEMWSKMSTSGMFLYISHNVRQHLDKQPEELVGVSIQQMMRAESKTEFNRILEFARTGKSASVKHELINRRGQVLSAFTTLYPGDASEGQKPTFIVAQTRMIKYSRNHNNVHGNSSRPNMYNKQDHPSMETVMSGSQPSESQRASTGNATPLSGLSSGNFIGTDGAAATYGGQQGLLIGQQDHSLASEDNLFDELKTTKSSSWQYEIRQLERKNRVLAEEVQSLIAAKKKRKRRKGAGNMQKDCANCHTKVTPEWRRGPSGQRDLCNSCGLRFAKLNGRVSPRTNSDKASRNSVSPQGPLLESAQAPSVLRTDSGSSKDNSAKKPSHKGGHGSHMEGAAGVPTKIEEGVE